MGFAGEDASDVDIDVVSLDLKRGIPLSALQAKKQLFCQLFNFTLQFSQFSLKYSLEVDVCNSMTVSTDIHGKTKKKKKHHKD